MSKKLYHLKSHSWITVPDPKTGLSKLGISDYAMKFFLRFNKVDISEYPKTNYGMNNVTLINLFVKQTKIQYQNQLIQKQKQRNGEQTITLSPKQGLTLSEKMQYDRFLIKKNEPFAKIQTYEYNVEMSAPVDMRVVDQNFQNWYYTRFLTVPYFFEVECLNTKQLHDLISQQQYIKSAKFFEYC